MAPILFLKRPQPNRSPAFLDEDLEMEIKFGSTHSDFGDKLGIASEELTPLKISASIFAATLIIAQILGDYFVAIGIKRL